MVNEPEIHWQPVDQIGTVLLLVQGMVRETREQRTLYRDAEVATLDADTVARIRRAYADRLDLIGVFRRQLARWREGRLTGEQARAAAEIEQLQNEDEKLSQEVERQFGVRSVRSGGRQATN